ncbi:MAG: (Fe-S)-binding protein [Flavobacteriales bacterium]|nr:(Fe-S)-binding protein [Flavobacteriales bacterium]
MTKQIAFFAFMALGLGLFSYTIMRLISFFKITQGGYVLDNVNERITTTLKVAFGQTKILRKPMIGFLHALVYWGFMVITVGTGEMVVDGMLGTERILGVLGPVYDFITWSGDVFAAIIVVACVIFLARRHIITIKRFSGVEMTKGSTIDATIALLMITFLMVSLIGMNMGYLKIAGNDLVGSYPISSMLLGLIDSMSHEGQEFFFEFNWWAHIVLVFTFLNILPYSKHFHVIMSIPNVFFTKMGPLTHLNNMPHITKEVRIMMELDEEVEGGDDDEEMKFGIKDIEDVSWKDFANSLTCTQCGRCTDVCPANITGKLLSPRKIMVDTRRRMNDKGPGLAKDPEYSDDKSLVGVEYITPEELWACTTCNACVQECPVNIDHVTMIIDMRRNLVMEAAEAPQSFNEMFSNIENNGAPWSFAQEDRMKWAEDITIN